MVSIISQCLVEIPVNDCVAEKALIVIWLTKLRNTDSCVYYRCQGGRELWAWFIQGSLAWYQFATRDLSVLTFRLESLLDVLLHHS